MKNKLIALLAESSELEEFFTKFEQFEICAVTNKGSVGISLIEKHRPDAVICDLVLEDMDGITVLDKLAEKGLNTKVLLSAGLHSDEVIRLALSRGACGYFTKSTTPEMLQKKIEEVIAAKRPQRPPMRRRVMTGGEQYLSDEVQSAAELRVSNVFLCAGIPPHIKGYGFLRTGVLMAISDPDLLGNITKRLYPMIAETYSTSPSKVERAIRHAIEVAWNRGRIENLNSVFGVTFYQSGDKPTNGEFIALIADRLIQEMHMGKL